MESEGLQNNFIGSDFITTEVETKDIYLLSLLVTKIKFNNPILLLMHSNLYFPLIKNVILNLNLLEYFIKKY